MTASCLASLPAIDTAPSKDEQVDDRRRRARVACGLRPGQEAAVAGAALHLGAGRSHVMRACQRFSGEGSTDRNARRNIVAAPLSQQRVAEEFAVPRVL